MAEPNLELVQREMVLFAAEGQHDWRRALDADLAFLRRVTAVEEQFAAAGRPRTDPDADLDAIVAAVSDAIQRLRQPFRDVAREQFGFTDPNPTTPRKKGARETDAAKKLGISKRTYELPSSNYRGASPRDYVIELVACSMRGIADPVAFTAGREPAADKGAAGEADPPTARRRPPRRWPAVLGGFFAVCVAVLAVAQLGGGPSSRRRGGTTVSISDPRRIARQGAAGPSPMDGTGGGRIILERCVAAQCRKAQPRTSPTESTSGPPLGTVFWFRLEILDSYRAQIASMNLRTSSTVEEGSNSVTAVARWLPPIPSNHVEVRASTVSLPAPTQTASGLPRLEYVAGSTELYERGASGEVPVFKLPDGLLFPSGLTLTHVGVARECRIRLGECPLAAMAIIHFEMRLVA